MKKPNKETKDIDIDEIFDKVSKLPPNPNTVIFKEKFGINLNLSKTTATGAMLNLLQPYRFVESRVIKIDEGVIICRVNLIEYTLNKGTVALLKQGSLYEIIRLSDDFRMQIIAFSYESINVSSKSSNRAIITIKPDAADWTETGNLFKLIHDIAKHLPFRLDVIKGLISVLIDNIINIEILVKQDKSKGQNSRAEETFDKFILLVNTYSDNKQGITFYAEKLCITPHYLSHLVTAVSGQSAMYWINKAVILEAMIKLKNTTLTISEIAESLNFSNITFFCRFFKRLTGKTPNQYRNC